MTASPPQQPRVARQPDAHLAIDVIDSLDAAVAVFDADQRLLFCNHAYRSVLGLAAELFQPGVTFADLVRATADVPLVELPGTDRDDWISWRLERFRACDEAFQQRLTDGRWMLVQDRPTADGGRISILADITALRDSRRALEEERALLRQVLDAVPAMISVKDTDLRYLLVNELTARNLGTTMEETLGRRADTFLGPDGDRVLPYDRQVLDEGRTVTFEEDVVIRGERVHWHTTKTPLRNDRGEIDRILSVWSDVSEQKRAYRRLQENEQRLRDFSAIASDWLWETDETLRLVFVTGPDDDARGNGALGSPPWAPTGVDTLGDAGWERLRKSMEAGDAVRDLTVRFAVSDSGIHHALLNARPVRDAEGRVSGYRGTARDVSELIHARERLAGHERRLSAIADNLQGLIFERHMTTDGKLHYPFFAGSAKYLSAMPVSELDRPGVDAMEPVHEEDRKAQRERIEHSARTLTEFTTEFRVVDGDGRVIWIRQSNRPRREPDGTVVWDCLEIDITERKRMEERARQLALYDEVTGLPNRNLLNDRAVVAIASARRDGEPLALVVVGLRRFSDINTAHGLKTGDRVLRLVGERIDACAARGDTVARLQGDRFAILLTGLTDNREVFTRIESLLRQIADPLDANGRLVHVSACAGVAIHPDDGEDFNALLTAAESAYRAAHAQGPGRFAFADADRNRLARTHAELESELRAAVGTEAMFVWLQPIVDAIDRSVRACEALVRWQHPTQGLLPAARFMDVAAAAGLLERIDEQVLREVCRALRHWRDAGLKPVPVSVNLDAERLEEPGFANRLLGLLSEFEVSPSLLILELTERALVRNAEEVARTMQRLAEGGVRFAIDDFGTGYSALSYLPHLPISQIKIDRAFIDRIEESDANAAIVQAIVAMARSLRLKVVGEGVETEREALFLRAFQCDCIQGYLTGAPMPPEQFEALLARA